MDERRFVKDGRVRFTADAGTVVSLEFDGWMEQAEPAMKPTPGRTESRSVATSESGK